MLDGQNPGSVRDDDMSVEFHFSAEDGRSVFRRRTASTAVEFRFATVLDSQMDLDGDFGVESFFAKSATVKMVGVHVQQVFLKLVRRRETLDARRAVVLVPAEN